MALQKKAARNETKSSSFNKLLLRFDHLDKGFSKCRDVYRSLDIDGNSVIDLQASSREARLQHQQNIKSAWAMLARCPGMQAAACWKQGPALCLTDPTCRLHAQSPVQRTNKACQTRP